MRASGVGTVGAVSPTRTTATFPLEIGSGSDNISRSGRCGAQRLVMDARQLIGGGSFPPDELHIIFGAFDDAWAALGSEVSSRAAAIETARQSLAEIVLSIAKAGPIDRDKIKIAAIKAFRGKHRLGRRS